MTKIDKESLRVCIPPAGIGSRLGNLSKSLNKSLVEIGSKPAICHIIESYNPNTEFVIPLGYGSNELKQFLKLAYPKKK